MSLICREISFNESPDSDILAIRFNFQLLTPRAFSGVLDIEYYTFLNEPDLNKLWDATIYVSARKLIKKSD